MDQTKYYMTEYSNSTVGRWEACSACTITGAKREATARYDGGYAGTTLEIAEGDNVTEERLVLSRKINGSWEVVK